MTMIIKYFRAINELYVSTINSDVTKEKLCKAFEFKLLHCFA